MGCVGSVSSAEALSDARARTEALTGRDDALPSEVAVDESCKGMIVKIIDPKIHEYRGKEMLRVGMVGTVMNKNVHWPPGCAKTTCTAECYAVIFHNIPQTFCIVPEKVAPL